MIGTSTIEAKLDTTNALLRELLEAVKKINQTLTDIKQANQEHFEARQNAHKPHR